MMRRSFGILAVVCLVFSGLPLLAQGGGTGNSGWSFDWDIEGKFHYRDSDESVVTNPFPFRDLGIPLPPGQDFALLTTVDPGEHFEVSTLTLYLDVTKGEFFEAKAKVDFIDRYDRNPTSEDREVDIDELWLRFGRETEPGRLPDGTGGYLKIGKFPHFERQDDRHLESYGLVSTAFNRFEDSGIELGLDLGRHFYLKGSYTQGNPLFIRDPNALAGDNGLARSLAAPNLVPELGSGLVIFYDAEVENIEFGSDPELGLGAGFRIGETWTLDVLLWAYQRDLAETAPIRGTLYGGDLDILSGPINTSILPFEGNKKEEFGANVWFYSGGLSLFAQLVDGEIAKLPRDGWEVEASYAFDLPLQWSIRGKQLFTYIQPAIRVSELNTAIPITTAVLVPVVGATEPRGDQHFPAITARWDWEKIDYGLRLGIYEGIDLTLEFSDNTTTTLGGVDISHDELLTTLRWKI